MSDAAHGVSDAAGGVNDAAGGVNDAAGIEHEPGAAGRIPSAPAAPASAAGPVPSPCISVCRIEPASGLCEGCLRTLDEIARWGSMDNEARHEVWRAIHARRASRPGP